jgi:hypothetical protein
MDTKIIELRLAMKALPTDNKQIQLAVKAEVLRLAEQAETDLAQLRAAVGRLEGERDALREACEKIKAKSEMWQQVAQSTASAKAIPPWWNLGYIAAAALEKAAALAADERGDGMNEIKVSSMIGETNGNI